MISSEEKKVIKKVVSIVFIVIGSVILYIILFIASTYFFGTLSIQQPEIKYGEFPFKLVYRIGEEVVTIEDTYICEYKGRKYDIKVGSGRIWDGYMKNTGEPNCVIVEEDGRVLVRFMLSPYECMGDGYKSKTLEGYFEGEVPDAEFREWKMHMSEDGTLETYLISAEPLIANLSKEEILEYYDIEVLHWEITEPIKNTFK